MPTIIETLFNRTAALKAEHEMKIEDVKDSLWNKDWIVSKNWEKALVGFGIIALLIDCVFILIKIARGIW